MDFTSAAGRLKHHVTAKTFLCLQLKALLLLGREAHGPEYPQLGKRFAELGAQKPHEARIYCSLGHVLEPPNLKDKNPTPNSSIQHETFNALPTQSLTSQKSRNDI